MLAQKSHDTDGSTRARYLRYRSSCPFTPARVAIEQARKRPETIDWNRSPRGGAFAEAAFEIDGFSVVVRQYCDHDADASHIGKYADRWQAGAIDRGKGYPDPEWDRREYRYFISASTEHVQESRRYRSRKLGQDRHNAWVEARSMIFDDYRRMEALQRGHWHFLGLEARAFKKGVELGRSSVWGIESDSDPEYIDETAWEEIHESLAAAKAKLAELCGAQAEGR